MSGVQVLLLDDTAVSSSSGRSSSLADDEDKSSDLVSPLRSESSPWVSPASLSDRAVSACTTPSYKGKPKKAKTLKDTLSDPSKAKFDSEVGISGLKFSLDLKPLSMYYAKKGLAVPVPTSVSSYHLPQPYRKLLFHEKYMTPRLEEFYERGVYLRPLMKQQVGTVISRCVCLEIDGDEEDKDERFVVEFGAIQIYLHNIPEEVHPDILEAKKPFGACLVDHKIPNRCLPKSFFKIPCDRILGSLFNVRDLSDSIEENERNGKVLYGRLNVLLNPTDGVMAEVVEILPPQDTVKVDITSRTPASSSERSRTPSRSAK